MSNLSPSLLTHQINISSKHCDSDNNCVLCGQYYASFLELSIHFNESHIYDTSPPLPSTTTVSTASCDYSAESGDSLINHLRIHTDEKLLTDPKCDDMVFYDINDSITDILAINNIVSHNRNNSIIEIPDTKLNIPPPRPFPRPLCDYSSTHLRAHTDEKPMSCTECSDTRSSNNINIDMDTSYKLNSGIERTNTDINLSNNTIILSHDISEYEYTHAMPHVGENKDISHTQAQSADNQVYLHSTISTNPDTYYLNDPVFQTTISVATEEIITETNSFNLNVNYNYELTNEGASLHSTIHTGENTTLRHDSLLYYTDIPYRNDKQNDNNPKSIPGHSYSINPRKTNIRFMSLNVCGLCNRMENPNFLDDLAKYDIISLCETKTDDADTAYIQEVFGDLGFTAFLQNRKNFTNKRSGGTLVAIRSELCQWVKRVTCTADFLIVLNIDKGLFNFEKNVIYITVYIPPLSSRYSNIDLFNSLSNIILNFDPDDHYHLLAGDLNAHTKTNSDLIFFDKHIIEMLELDEDTRLRLEITETMAILDLPIDRYSVDVTEDSTNYGKALLELCKNHLLCIFNGRAGEDRCIGSATPTKML